MKAKGNWTKELSAILWAYHCSPQSTIRKTSFRISYGSDTMIPLEVGEPSLQNMNFVEEGNNETLKEALDLTEETIKEVYIRAELYQRRAEKRYNSRVKPRNFLTGDLVLRKYGEA